jgi:hypothetical protein
MTSSINYTFTCGICCDEKPLGRKMVGSALGCHCAGEICVGCFMMDFETRAGKYFVAEGAVSKWNDENALAIHLFEQFQNDSTYTQDENFPIAFTAFFKKSVFKGKQCPFCAQTCLWHLDTAPHVKEGRIQFTNPNYVISKPFPV